MIIMDGEKMKKKQDVIESNGDDDSHDDELDQNGYGYEDEPIDDSEEQNRIE